MPMRVCPQCRMVFRTDDPERAYCSGACQKAHAPPRARNAKKASRPLLGARRGESNQGAKLTDDRVREIRARYDNRTRVPVTMRQLAAEYRVSPTAIYYVLKGAKWAHVQ